MRYNTSSPLVFDLWEDPSEAHPLDLSDVPLADIIAAHDKVCVALSFLL